MFSDPEQRKRIIRSVIFILIFIIGIMGINYRNHHMRDIEAYFMTADVDVFVCEKPLNGLTEDLLCDDCFITMMEKQICDNLDKRLSLTYPEYGPACTAEEITTESWYQTKKEKNFIIIRQTYKNSINATSIIGINGANLIQITGCSVANSVPYTYGPCAKKMKDIFGFSLKNGHNKHS